MGLRDAVQRRLARRGAGPCLERQARASTPELNLVDTNGPDMQLYRFVQEDCFGIEALPGDPPLEEVRAYEKEQGVQ